MARGWPSCAESISVEAGGERPDLWVSHVTVPHVPWIRSATGRQYASPDARHPPVRRSRATWSADEPDLVRQSFQRHLLQLGYVDRLLGQVMDELDESGTWDETLLVVTADHGISFRPGSPLRTPTPETAHEIYNVPLFIKLPGQERGRNLDENALTIDVLPTIVDALNIDTEWEFDGESLLADEHRPDKPVEYAGTHTVVPPGFDGVLEIARRNATLLPYGDDWLGVAAVGTYGDLVGRSVDRARHDDRDRAGVASRRGGDPGGLGPGRVRSWRRCSCTATSCPASSPSRPMRSLPSTAPSPAPSGTSRRTDGGLRFSALLAEELLEPGDNEVTLLVPVSPPGARAFQAAALSPGARTPG